MGPGTVGIWSQFDIWWFILRSENEATSIQNPPGSVSSTVWKTNDNGIISSCSFGGGVLDCCHPDSIRGDFCHHPRSGYTDVYHYFFVHSNSLHCNRWFMGSSVDGCNSVWLAGYRSDYSDSLCTAGSRWLGVCLGSV